MSDVPNHKFPKTVYKYRSWNDVFHRALLYENQVFLSSPKHFNDPFDCQIYPNIYLLDTDEKKQKYAHELVDMNMSTILKLNQHPEEKFFEIMRELIVDLESHQIKTERYLFEIYNQQFGVLSLSGIWNSILMWSHYADYHKGFCVGFNEEALRKSGHFGRGGKVQYKSKFPQFYPGFSYLNNEDETLKRYFDVTHTKALKWSYEKEYRLLKIFNAMNHLEEKERIVTLPNECFTEIILGLNFPEVDKSVMVGIAKRKKIPLYQAIKNPFQFSMKRVRII